VGNVIDGTVTKLLAATGEPLGTYQLDGSPDSMAFDGANVWVAIVNADYVYKLSAATGAVAGTYLVGPAFGHSGMAFDGANIWVTNYASGTVSKL
jgi:DNA-binding beta-propeller fold protein YncE